MKITKNAEQKNVILNTECYVRQQVARMLETREAFFFAGEHGFTECYDLEKWDDQPIRIFTENLTEIKVALVDGFYETVATGKNGETYFVSLS